MIMETIVQFIELTFYIWIVINLSKISYEVTFVRYFDWFITTPIMLISTALFMEYLNKRNESTISVNSVFNSKYTEIVKIFVSNLIMLVFGFLSEIKIIPRIMGFILGTLAFSYSFYILYTGFVGSDVVSNYLFYFLTAVWFMYGIAFLFPYITKNIMYNFLDIVSKNFYGLFVYYNILQVSKTI